MSKKYSLIGLGLAAALPLAAQAVTVSYTTNLQGWGGSSAAAGGVQSTAGLVPTNLTAVVTISTLPSSTTLDPAGPNSIVLNGSLSNVNLAAPPFARYTWTFTNATYNIAAGPGYDSGFYAGAAPGPGQNFGGFCTPAMFCLDSGWNANPVGGAATGAGTTLNPAVDTFGGLLAAGYQTTSALTLAGGTVSCVNALMAACAATVDGTVWDAFSARMTMNFGGPGPVSVVGGTLAMSMIGSSSVFSVSSVSAVPVPAAVWLFGSALGVFGLVRRRISA